jgi:hypothetical protein
LIDLEHEVNESSDSRGKVRDDEWAARNQKEVLDGTTAQGRLRKVIRLGLSEYPAKTIKSKTIYAMMQLPFLPL